MHEEQGDISGKIKERENKEQGASNEGSSSDTGISVFLYICVIFPSQFDE